MLFLVCLNRCQTKGKNYDTTWKMITRRETYFVILMIIVNSFSTFHCPTNRTCIETSCELNYEGGFEINCSMGNGSSFIVNIQPNQYILVCTYLILSRHKTAKIYTHYTAEN